MEGVLGLVVLGLAVWAIVKTFNKIDKAGYSGNKRRRTYRRYKRFKTPLSKTLPSIIGNTGESFVNTMIKENLDATKYYLMENVTLPMNDSTTQIDHIVVSQFGIFVIETKNMQGWIYGYSTYKEWTLNLFGNTYKFQNPVYQNDHHIKALQILFGISRYCLVSCVVFVGDCLFKTRMPARVFYREDLIRFIQSKRKLIIAREKCRKIINQINSKRLEPSFETQEIHRANVKKYKQ